MATMPKPDQHPHSTELPQLSNTDAGSSGGAPTAVGLPVGDCVGEPLGAHVSPPVGIAVGEVLHRPGIPLQSKLSTPAFVRCAHAAGHSTTSDGEFMSSTTKNAAEALLGLGHTLPTLCVA